MLNLQYLPMHVAVAALKTSDNAVQNSVQKNDAAAMQLSTDPLQVVSVATPSIVAPSTIQATAEPSVVDVLALQSVSSIAVAISVSNAVSTVTLTTPSVLTVQPIVNLFSLANGASLTQVIQEAIAANTVPVRDTALPPNSESSTTAATSTAYAFALLLFALVIINKESKGFALADSTTVLRC